MTLLSEFTTPLNINLVNNTTEWQRIHDELHKDHFQRVFGNKYVNGLNIGLYILGLVSCLGLLLVSWFEKSGQAGPRRTLVNQLMSSCYDQIVFGYVSVSTLFVVRTQVGPLPLTICNISLMITSFTTMNGCLLIVGATGTRFVFAYVFKSIPVLDDDFMAIFIRLTLTSCSVMATMIKYSFDQRINPPRRLCSGTWSAGEEHQKTYPIVATVYLGSWLIHTVLGIAIKFKWRKLNQMDHASENRYQSTTTPKSNLASMTTTLVSIGSMCLLGISIILLNKFGSPNFLNQFPNAWIAHCYMSIGPFVAIASQSTVQYMKHHRLRRAVKRIFVPSRIHPSDLNS